MYSLYSLYASVAKMIICSLILLSHVAVKGTMNRAENEAYWGSTDTAPSALDNFFDEDVSGLFCYVLFYHW